MAKEVILMGLRGIETELHGIRAEQYVACVLNKFELERKIINDMFDKDMLTKAQYTQRMEQLLNDVEYLKTS